MRYIIPLFDCVLNDENNTSLNKNVQYLCENVDNKNFVVVGKNQELPFSLNLVDIDSQNVQKIIYKNNEYYFLNAIHICAQGFYQFKYLNKQIIVALFENLIISIDGQTVLNAKVQNIKYSHFEINNQICYIYFSGFRNYIVVINGTEVKCNTYYDEINIEGNEFYFMCKQFDSLNHGKVFHIKDKTFEDYLVYLDNFDLNLKPEFLSCVFLDCVMAGNLHYANNLLSDELRQVDASYISKFFVDFDFYYPINTNEIILFKKNTLAGIYSFEISNLQITNITQQV